MPGMWQLRAEANKTAAEAVRAAVSKVAEATKGAEDMTGPSPGKRARTDCQAPDCLTVAEEHVLQDYFLAGLLEMSSNTLKLPLSVEATVRGSAMPRHRPRHRPRPRPA